MLDKENLTVLTDAISKIMNPVADAEPVSLDEAVINEKLKPAKGKSVLDIDFAGEEADMDAVAKKYRIKVKKGKLAGTALVAGDNKNILAYLQSDDYAMDDENIMDIYPEVVAEGKRNEFIPFAKSDAFISKDNDAATGRKVINVRSGESFKILKTFGTMKDAEKYLDKVNEAYDRNKLVNKVMKPIKDKEALKPKPKKEEKGDKEDYEKFFAAALKKFGVDSPAQLKTDEKKKEFFDYVDKNWEGKGEVKEAVGANGHAGPQQDPNQGLSPKAKLIKAFQEPEAPEYADANKTALSTFANIMNSVNVVTPNRGSDVTEQDPAPENTIQKLANSTK